MVSLQRLEDAGYEVAAYQVGFGGIDADILHSAMRGHQAREIARYVLEHSYADLAGKDGVHDRGNDGGCRYQRIVSGFQSHERFETDKPVVGDLDDRLVPGLHPVLAQSLGYGLYGPPTLDMRQFHGRVVEVDRSRFACLAMIQRQIGLVDQRVEGCERRALRNAACRADTDAAFSQVDRLFDRQQQVAGEVLNLVLRHR